MGESTKNKFQRSRAGDEWRGAKFIWVSLIVTTLSIIFFFAGRHLFPKMSLTAQSAMSVIGGQLAEWSGLRISSVELQIRGAESEGTTALNFSPMKPVIREAESRLKKLEGQNFWGLNLQKYQSDLLAQGWAKSFSARRRFPGVLGIELELREPRLLIHGERWAAVDSEGYLVYLSREIPGSWAELPMVFGLEEKIDLDSSLAELNRKWAADRDPLSDLAKLVQTLQKKLGVHLSSVRVQNENWSSEWTVSTEWTQEEGARHIEALFRTHLWEGRLENFQFVLSDGLQRLKGPLKIMGTVEGRWFVRQDS